MAQHLPKEYKVGVFEAKGEPIKFRQVKLELPKPGEVCWNSPSPNQFFSSRMQVLVKVLACGVCHSDHLVRFGLLGNSFPIIPGHEIIGEVAAVPDTEKKWQVRDRVGGAWHGAHDQTCHACQRGLFQMCEQEQINGVTRNGVCSASLFARLIADNITPGIW